ncbi:MAG: FAD-binding oxidoreductase [Chitinophagales bacterium]|nr:FAD-binding oxidoreductase [Chitinophagales bacterium]
MPNAPKWLFDAVELFTTNQTIAEVVETKFISTSIKKICLKSGFKKKAFSVGAYIDFRVSDTEVRRYTVSSFDAKKNTIEILVYIHNGTPGCFFMDNLGIGDRIRLNKLNELRKYYNDTKGKYVIFGDETSLGIARSFMPLLKKNQQQFLFYFELDEENRKIPELLEMENYEVFSKTNTFKNQEWIDNLSVFQTSAWENAHFVLTGNVQSVQTFRKVIKEKTSGKIHVHGYWLKGKKGL